MSFPSDFYRYEKYEYFTSKLDPISDIIVLIESLTSKEYLSDIIKINHSNIHPNPNKITKRIIPYIKIALSYINQSLNGAHDVAFLPMYYSFLNLAKVYILLGKHYQDLDKQQYHGASYKSISGNNNNLLNERIELNSGGAIPLLYKTITNSVYCTRPNKFEIKLKDVYPYIFDISFEYQLISKKPTKLVHVNLYRYIKEVKAKITPYCEENISWNKSQLKFIKTLRNIQYDDRQPKEKVSYITFNSKKDIYEQIKTYMLYFPSSINGDSLTPVSSAKIDLFEELPIILMYFHLSSVVRYKPEFLIKLKDSKFWPIISASRTHCLLKFLTLFWSYLHQKRLAY